MIAIPEDILAAAEKACLRPTTAQDRINNVAKAILAERQRCVDVAVRVSEQCYEDSVYPVERIRAAILTGDSA